MFVMRVCTSLFDSEGEIRAGLSMHGLLQEKFDIYIKSKALQVSNCKGTDTWSSLCGALMFKACVLCIFFFFSTTFVVFSTCHRIKHLCGCLLPTFCRHLSLLVFLLLE